MRQDGNSQIILNFLDKVLDENIKNAQNLLSLKFAIDEQRADIDKILEEVRDNLKTDLKSYISQNNEQVIRKISDLEKTISGRTVEQETELIGHRKRAEKIEIMIDGITKKGRLIKWIAILVASLATLTGGVVALEKVVADYFWPKKTDSSSTSFILPSVPEKIDSN